jgi:CPA2 family monovalent cation:H+ antiporter-2
MHTSLDLAHVAIVLSLVLSGGLLLERFRQPALVGYILSGALIGPSLLGIQGDNDTLRWMADVAIILLMFMLGLELDASSFRRSFGTALLAAGLQAVVGVGVMLGIAPLLGIDHASAILFGFIAALSSTAVAMTTLHTLGEEGSELARKATAILIAQDILAVPMLLTVGTLGEGFGMDSLLKLGLSLTVIAASLFGIFELVRHPRWVEALENLFTRGISQPIVSAMALCFGAAALSAAVGLSGAYGAFAIGLLIGNVGSIGSSYRAAAHPVHELLMMVFFVSIGLMFDFAFAFEHWLLIASILALVIFLKTVFTIGILRALGVPKEMALSLGAVLGQIGEFSFVLISLGLAEGFIDSATYKTGLIIIALSLAISPLWHSLSRRRAARLATPALPAR